MQFIDLPEPFVNCSHVPLHSSVRFRLDARHDTAAIVITEYEKTLPFFQLSGEAAESRSLFDKSLALLKNPSVREPWTFSEAPPFFTLDLRPTSHRQAMVSGFSDGSVKLVAHGEYPVALLSADVASVVGRLAELGRVFYAG
jgi:hypothetical protein